MRALVKLVVGGAAVEAQIFGTALCLLLLSERGAKFGDHGCTQLHGGGAGGGHGSTVGRGPGGSGRGRGSSGGGVGPGGVPGEGLVGIMDKSQLASLGVVEAVVGVQHTGTQLRAQTLDKVGGHHSVPGRDGHIDVQLHEVQFEASDIVDQGAAVGEVPQALLHIHLVIWWLKLLQHGMLELTPGGGGSRGLAKQQPPIFSSALKASSSIADPVIIIVIVLQSEVLLTPENELPSIHGQLSRRASARKAGWRGRLE